MTAQAQKFLNWRVYKSADGLQESECKMIGSSQHNNVWVFHGEPGFFSSLDGYEAKKVFLPGLAYSRLYENRVGQLWAVSADGVQEFSGRGWLNHPIKEIRAAQAIVRQMRIPLLPLKQGHVLILLPDRLLEFSNDRPEATLVRDVKQTKLENFSDLIMAADGGAWISGQNGLAKIPADALSNPNATWQEFLLEPESQIESLQHLFEDDRGGITATGSQLHKKMIVYFDGQKFVLPPVRQEIQEAWRGLDGAFWFTTAHALFRLENRGGQWRETEEQLAAEYFDVMTEPAGAFWLATSEGLFRYTALTWRSPVDQNFNVPVHAALRDREERLWVAQDDGLMLFQNERWQKISFPEKIQLALQPSALFELPNGMLALSTRDELVEFNPKIQAFSTLSNPAGQRLKALGALKDGSLCVQPVPSNATGAERLRLESCDGAMCKPFLEIPAAIKLGSELSIVLAAQNGAIWVGGNGGVAFYRDQKWQSFNPAEGPIPDSAFCLLENSDGKIWCGTRDQVWQFDGKEWSLLQTGLDRVNAFFKGRDGSIWIAANSGIHRFQNGDWVSNGIEEGLPSQVVRHLLEDQRGRLWAGTARGLSLHHPEADTTAPQTFIEQPRTENISPEWKSRFVFGGRDKWKQTPSDRLLFSYRLDEQEWSPFRAERTASFEELSPGKHFFQVRAMDRNWNVDPTPALLEFALPLPWYQETRLLLIAAAGAIGVLFFAALAFNRHRRLVRSYAEVERIVALRTRQLEKANQQLFQSQKMNALGTLAAGIAHDFNSILSIIKGSAQIIEGNLSDSEKIRTRVGRIRTAVDQGAGIVKAMLGFSRVSEKEIVPCHINAVVEETVRLLGDRFQREVEVKFQPATSLPQVTASKDFIQQIVLNFILNAAEAMSGPGKIIVSTGQHDRLLAEMILSPAEANNYLFVSVQDFGCGIAPEILPRIFEPFFTTKAMSVKRGTGLGLSMVYELAKEMSAGLSVSSELGKGSTFTLILPVHAKPESGSAIS